MTGIVTRTFSGTTDTIVAGDTDDVLRFAGNADCVLSITAAATLGAGFACAVLNEGTVDAKLTLDPNGTEKIDGAATLDLFPGDKVLLNCDNVGGAEFRTVLASTPRNLVLFGISLPSGVFKRSVTSALAIGDTDLYTCPTGKRAFVMGPVFYNNSAGSITWFPEIKVAGSYYRLANNSTTGTGGTTFTVILGNGFILEAGEILAINCATTAGGVIHFPIIEFDASASLKTAKVLGGSLINGDNTIYTCPAGKSALPLGTLVGHTNGGSNPATVFFVADGTNRNVKFNMVASGGSPTGANQVSATATVTANQRGSAGFLQSTLGAGDFVNMNLDVAAASQIVWFNVLEI